MAGAYGNRTHQEPVSKPLTGFEDRAGHQPRTHSRWRLTSSNRMYPSASLYFKGSVDSDIYNYSLTRMSLS